MQISRRSLRRPLLGSLLIAAILFLAACGANVDNASFAGLSTDGEKVYVAFGPGVLAYNPETNEDWTFPADPEASLLFYSAPNSDNGQLTFGDYGKSGGFLSPRVTVTVYAVEDTESGTPPTNWVNDTAATDKIVAPTLQVGDQVFVGTADNAFFSLDRDTGSEQWSYSTDHAIWGQPVYQDGIIYLASMDWSISALDATTGQELWSTELGGALPSGPVLGDGMVYVSSFDSSVYALDMDNGEIAWQAPAADVVWGAPAVADGVLYYADISGHLNALDAQTGDSIWTVETNSVLQAAPVISGDSIFVVSEVSSGDDLAGTVGAYSTLDGERLWQTPITVPLYTTPVIIGDDTIVVALDNADALLIGLNTETGTERWRYALETSS